MSLRTMEMITMLGLPLSVIACLYLAINEIVSDETLLIIMAVVCGVYALLMLLFWRCPHCRKSLPIQNALHNDYCPRCGKPL